MKNFIVLLFALLMAAQAFSQKKGKEEEKDMKSDSLIMVTDSVSAKTDSVAKVTTTTTVKVDSATKAPATSTEVAATTTAKTDSVAKISGTDAVQLDSLIKVTNLLTAKFNTVHAELEKYRGVYIVLKEKVLKRDFEPEQFSLIVDSLIANRDSTQFGFAAVTASFKDSLAVLQKEIGTLKVMVDAANAEDAAKLKLVNELKLLKDLLDSKIITQTEFDIKKTLVLQKWK